MNLSAILEKLKKGETLSEAEQSYLDNLATKDDNRIPKSRLDEALSKFNAEKAKAENLSTKMEELQAKLDELESAGQTETEKLKNANAKELKRLTEEVASLTKARDEAIAKATAMEFDSTISSIASRHNFTDKEYLGFLVKQKGDALDLNDETAVTSFIKELETSSPNLFKSNLKSGGGAQSNPPNVNETADARLKELMGKEKLTNQELSEVISINEKAKTQEQQEK